VSEPLFNPTGGYAELCRSAAFVLILQQTLAGVYALLAVLANAFLRGKGIRDAA
jgi:hypothetical protein